MGPESTATAAVPAPAPVAPPPPDQGKGDKRDELMREFVNVMKDGQIMQAQLLKEHTAAVASNTRSMDLLREAVLGTPPNERLPEGREGLYDQIDDTREILDSLGETLTATNVTLARYAYVFDVLVDVNTGDPAGPELEVGKDPEPGMVYKTGRVPTFMDVVAALRKFDAEAEDEAKKMEEADAKEKQEADERAKTAGTPPKPSMMGNGPPKKPMLLHGGKPLPPLPVARPMPK